MASNQGKETSSRRSSLIGLSGVFANKFSLWETRTSGEAGTGADQDAQLPQTTRSGSFGGKMRRLLSPKVSRSQRHPMPFGPDDPSSDISAGADADSSYGSGAGQIGSPFTRDTEVARSWPVTPASSSKSLWKKLVDKGAAGRPGHMPIAAGGSRYDSPHRSPGADSDTHGSEQAAEDEACGDGDSYYSYSPAQGMRLMARYSEEEGEEDEEAGEQGRLRRLQEPQDMEATVDLMNHALGMSSISQDTPVHGLQSLDSADLTPGFVDFANKMGAHITLDEADDFLRPAVDDTTVVLVPGTDLARAGAYGYEASPLFVPSAGASRNASRASPEPGTEAAGGSVASPPSLTALVSSLLHGEGSGNTATQARSVPLDEADTEQGQEEQLPVEVSEVQLQMGAERGSARSPSLPPDDFYAAEGQTAELNMRGRWGDDMTATPTLMAGQTPEVARRLSGSEDGNEADDSAVTPLAATAASAGQQEDVAEDSAAPAEEAALVAAAAEQLNAAEPELPTAEQEAQQMPAAADHDERPAAAETGSRPSLQALAAADELPAAADAPPISPARESMPEAAALDGAFGTPIATEPQAEQEQASTPTSPLASAPSSPAAPAPAALADANQDTAAAEAPATADEGATEVTAATEPTPMEAAYGGADIVSDDVSDVAVGSAPDSLRAHMISAEASQVDTEGEASEAPSSLTSPITEGAMFSMDVDMTDAPAEETKAAASPAKPSSDATAEAAELAAETEEQAEDGSVHVSTALPAAKDSSAQQLPQLAAAEETAGLPAVPAPAVEAASLLPAKQAEQGGGEDAAAVQEQQQLSIAEAEGEAPVAVESAEADDQVDQHTAEQAQAPTLDEGEQQNDAVAATAATEAVMQHIEQADAAVSAAQAPDAATQQVKNEQPQHSLGSDATSQAGSMDAVAAQQQGSLSAEASEEDMALMADATDVPLQLEDSMEAFPGLQSTASPELPGGATDTEGDNDGDPSSPTFDFQSLSHATHATPSPITAPPSRRDQLRRSIPLFDAGEGGSLIEDSNSSGSSTGAGSAAGAGGRRLSGGARQGGRGAVRESIPLFVRPEQQLSGGVGLDDERLEDLAPFRNYTSHGSGAGGARQGGVSPRAGAAGFVSSLAPVEEGSLDSPLGSEQSPTLALRHSPLSAPNSGSASRARALRSSASPDLHIGSPPQLHRLGGGGGSPSKFSPARTQALPASPAQPAAIGGRPSPTKAAAQTRSAFKATAAALAAAAITPGLAPSPIFGAPSPPTLQPLSTPPPSSNNTTPSLLDRTAASPSQVYRANMAAMETPYRQMAALPMQAALAAPLIDNSPFRLGEDAMDTICLADEAQRVLQSLAGGPGMSSGDLGNETMTLLQGHEGLPLDSPVASTGPSPSARLREMHVQMLTRQLTDAEARLHEMEVQNESLKDQLAALQFEKNAAESNDEFEREARLYAEEQLEQARAEIAQLEGAVSALRRQVTEAGEAAAVAAAARSAERGAWEEERGNLQLRLDEVQVERDSALDTINLNDVRMTALNSSIADLQAALAEEQARRTMLERAVANKEGEAREMARSAAEARSQLERAMEQLIAAQTGNEHASRRASDDAARIAALTSQLQTMAADQARTAGDVALLKQKYVQKSAALKEASQKLAAKDAECAELMAMCDQLLAQQEAGRGSEDTAGVMDQAA